mgnify:CR=1 FL=1
MYITLSVVILSFKSADTIQEGELPKLSMYSLKPVDVLVSIKIPSVVRYASLTYIWTNDLLFVYVIFGCVAKVIIFPTKSYISKVIILYYLNDKFFLIFLSTKELVSINPFTTKSESWIGIPKNFNIDAMVDFPIPIDPVIPIIIIICLF